MGSGLNWPGQSLIVEIHSAGISRARNRSKSRRCQCSGGWPVMASKLSVKRKSPPSCKFTANVHSFATARATQVYRAGPPPRCDEQPAIYLKAYQNMAEAWHGIGAYFEFYNHDRLH